MEAENKPEADPVQKCRKSSVNKEIERKRKEIEEKNEQLEKKKNILEEIKKK